MIIFELFEQDGLQVKISYKNTTDTAFPFFLPGCTELCPLKEFIALTSKMRPKSVKEECGLSPASDPAIQKVTLFAALLMICKGKRTSSAARYQPVGQNEDF